MLLGNTLRLIKQKNKGPETKALELGVNVGVCK